MVYCKSYCHNLHAGRIRLPVTKPSENYQASSSQSIHFIVTILDFLMIMIIY